MFYGTVNPIILRYAFPGIYFVLKRGHNRVFDSAVNKRYKYSMVLKSFPTRYPNIENRANFYEDNLGEMRAQLVVSICYLVALVF